MSQGRLISLLTALLWTASYACGLANEPDPAQQNDAQLADVSFVDAEHGWAAGDRGTIWHTEDGGQNWRLQPTHFDSRLSSVCFRDRKNGWAAGGWTHPFTHITTGIVLRTRDGGATWSIDRNSLLPFVRSIRFFDNNNGIAVGQQSANFPAGVFTTDDGGRSWSSLPPAGMQSWLVGDFSDPLTGVVAGRSGAVSVVRRRAIERSQGADFGLRSIHQVRLAESGNAWLVGDGGLVMRSDDGGLTWQTPPGEVPSEIRSQFDFCALASQGNHLWIAGSPGTRVLHSSDRGQTWQIHETHCVTPIRALHFLDEEHGWAVGDLGVILATFDGGRTWRTQRSGGQRAALVGVFSEPRDVPLELFAKLSGNDGFLGVVEILNRTDVETPTQNTLELPGRLHEAVVSAGACLSETAWRFPSRQSGLNLSSEQLLETWNRASDGRALDRMDEHLVRALRMWRPSVVVTTLTTAERQDPRVQLVNQLVLRAVEHAADANHLPQQLANTGLAPWRVTKVYGALAPGESGSTNIASAETTRGGRSIADLAAPGRGLLDRRYTPSAANSGFRLLVDQLPQDVGSRDFFSGIPLSPGGEARRMLKESPDQTVDAIRRSAQARRNLNAILARYDEQGQDDGRYLAEVTELVRTMDGGHAADVLLQLARRYHERGQWELAAETYDAVVERYPKHPASGAALVWLVQYYASGEAAWRVSQTQQVNTANRIAGGPKSGGETELRAASRNVRASAVVGLGNGDVDRPSRAAGYAKQLEAHSAALFSEPMVRFPLAAAHRGQGFPRQAERYFLGFVRNRPHDAWWAGAQAEVAQLASEEQRSGEGRPLPKPIGRCVRTQAKPRLDGKLTDPVWATARAIELQSSLRDDSDWPAVVMLAHDDEFLYLAVNCHEAPLTKFTSASGPRPRDGDLTAHDRVEVYLDIDRDYVTAYRLVIDSRGWTNDSCWGDPTWNPQWFVAAARNDDDTTGPAWTAEAAIPLSELSRGVTANQLWAIGIQRIVPNVGFQSWNQPAAVDVQGEGFGLLVFE